MGKDKETDKNSSLSADDISLWKALTKDVKRFVGREYQEAKGEDSPVPSTPEPSEMPQIRARSDKPSAAPQGREVDRRTAERLRKGQMPIDARIDLHGMNQGDARGALRGFIMNAQARGARCVLVITGKGRSGKTIADTDDRQPGVLKRNVPLWLGEEGLDSLVLKTASAQPRHGGDGALYVLLRRQR